MTHALLDGFYAGLVAAAWAAVSLLCVTLLARYCRDDDDKGDPQF